MLAHASMVLRAAFALLALCVLSLSSDAQSRSAAELRAYLTSGVVKLGADRVTLIVSVENARSAEVGTLPEVQGLAIGPLPGPNEQRSISIFGNRRQESVSRTWPIPVRANVEGTFVIPPFDVMIDGEIRKTPELTLQVVKDLRGEELGFLEIRPSSNKVIVGQPFSIELVFGFDVAIAEQTTYGNLALSWWSNLPGLLENQLPDAPLGRGRVRIAINDRDEVDVERLENRKANGREFITLRLVRSFTPTRTGEISVPSSFFEFGRVIERRDFFRTHREKAETYFARGPDFAISVVPLPEAGRPVDFSGAIGTLSVRADATPRDVDAGESIKLEVEWSGAGNLEFFTPPDPSRIEAFRDFRVYGRTEEKAFDRRKVIYDIAPITSQAKEIPALPLSVYDPGSERYTTLSTEPIPIRVRALEGANGLDVERGEERFQQDVRDLVLHPEPRDEPQPLGPAPMLALLAGLPAGWWFLRGFVRRRHNPDAPVERARRRARKALARGLAQSADARAQLENVYAFLAARSAESKEAWIGRPLASGVPSADPERLAELQKTIHSLERNVWGGEHVELRREHILAAADEAMRGGL